MCIHLKIIECHQIEKAVGDQFNLKKWQHTDGDVQISILHLNCHQGSSVDIAGEISSSFWNASEDVPLELSKEIEQAANKFDGTNACQFFSASFATLLVGNKPSVLQSLEGRARMKDSIESMIVTIAHKVNDFRDKSIPECLGGENVGILLFVDFKRQHLDQAINKVIIWIRERITHASKTASLQSLILMKPKESMPKDISAEYFLCDSDDDMLVVSMG
ncbi:Hypothetical predicted protein [Paramuricea clavata]|uniref:Uncharacterized protein n=1 Tax=Paramuricea clavata TaxID=317549 RepID=A0A7D9L1R2_PARCT|nr:Hypothetical predicted protein [Paramuricea clavata]